MWPRDPVSPVTNVTMHVGQSQQSCQWWVSPVLARGVVCIDTGQAGDTGYHRHPHPQPGSGNGKEAGAFLTFSQLILCILSVLKYLNTFEIHLKIFNFPLF